MNIVKYTDFTGEYSLPEIDAPSGRVLFESIAADTQRTKLISLLGIPAFLAFDEALKTEPIPENWAKFISGDSYNLNDEVMLFEGAKKMLVYFTWFDYTQFIQTRNTSTGEKAYEGQGSKVVNPIQKLVRGYNKGATIFNSAFDYIKAKELSNKETATILRHMNVLGI